MNGKVKGPSGRWIKINGPTFNKLSRKKQKDLLKNKSLEITGQKDIKNEKTEVKINLKEEFKRHIRSSGLGLSNYDANRIWESSFK